MADPLEIKQGTTRTIIVKKLRDAAGDMLDPTGWSVHAVARRGIWGAVAAEWVSGSPAPDQGQAEIAPADSDIDPVASAAGEKWIYLYITPEWSDSWTWRSAVLDIEVHEPSPTSREEAFSVDLRLIPTTVRA